MVTDRFGNPHAPDLPYARGAVLATTEDDFRKLQRAWALIRERGPDNIFILTGLEHGLPLTGDELRFADDEIAPALCFERLRTLALEHFGGAPDRHDLAVFNRMTGATLATHLSLVKPGDVVIGVSASHSHPSVARAAKHAGARFVDTTGVAMFEQAIADEARVALVALTRLAVTYDLLPVDEIEAVVRIGHDKGAVVYVDDAGGARVGPAGFGQPRMLELGVDIGATGLDKYGTVGPRLGLLAGRTDLVSRIRAKGFEFGLEARQQRLVEATAGDASFEALRWIAANTGFASSQSGRLAHVASPAAKRRPDSNSSRCFGSRKLRKSSMTTDVIIRSRSMTSRASSILPICA
jgi:L-seryl-tRNA(Ser) seleniumtransferase